MKRVALLAVVVFVASGHSQAAQRYSTLGLLVQVDRPHHTIDVSCQAIPSYMNAMEMRFPVRKRTALDGLQPGMMIEFTLAVKKHSAYVENIRIHRYESTDQEPMEVRQPAARGKSRCYKGGGGIRRRPARAGLHFD